MANSNIYRYVASIHRRPLIGISGQQSDQWLTLVANSSSSSVGTRGVPKPVKLQSPQHVLCLLQSLPQETPRHSGGIPNDHAHQPFSERDHSVIIHFVHINQKMWTVKQRSTGDATMFTMDKEKISYITWRNKRHESRSQKDPAAIFLSAFDSEYPDSFPGASVIMRPSDAITAQADTHRTGTVTPFLRRQYICESSSTDKTSHGTNNSQETVGNSSTTGTWQHYRQHRKHGNSPHVCCKL